MQPRLQPTPTMLGEMDAENVRGVSPRRSHHLARRRRSRATVGLTTRVGGMVWSPDVHWDPMNPRSPDAEEVDRFCEICGSPVLTMCESCGAAITRGPSSMFDRVPFAGTAAGRMAGQRGRRRSITSMISWLPSGGFPRLIVKVGTVATRPTGNMATRWPG